ncbi:MAG TPA: MATE family efflux transporter [Gammaproteobacteria bacterium]|nr:MATE family efflux transporter [Gammaproteobacteria bacterium]
MKTISVIKSLTYQGDMAPLLKLSIPLVLTGFMQSAIGFFENIFLSRLGPDYLAAGALVGWFYATLIVMIFGTLGAVNVLVAHKHGKKDIHGIANVWRDGLLFALVLVPPVFFLVWNMAPLFLLVGQHPHLVNLASHYLHALAFGLLPKLIMMVIIDALLGLGLARTITIFTVLTIPLYVFFSWVLIFGKFGFPALGIAGAGWGMTLGDWIASILICVYVLLDKQFRPYFRLLFSLKKPFYILDMIKLGLPMGLMYCIEVGFFLAMTLLMGVINIQSVAANQVTMQYLGPLMGSIFSIAQALTIRMGHEIGAKQIATAERAVYAAVCMVAVYMCVMAVIYWLMPDTLIAVDFNMTAASNVETIKLARDFIFIAALFQIIEAVRITLYGALRGLKDTHFSLLASVISFWFIALPIGYVTAIHFKFGGVGFWWGMVIGACCSVFLLSGRFKRKMHATVAASLHAV